MGGWIHILAGWMDERQPYNPPYSRFTLKLENRAKHSSCTHPPLMPCLTSAGWRGCSRQGHPSPPSPTLVALCHVIYLRPTSLVRPVAPDNCLFVFSPKGGSSIFPSFFVSLCSKPRAPGLVAYSAARCLTACSYSVTLPRGAPATASYHVLVSQSMSNNN